MILRTVEVNLNFDLGAFFDDIREIQYQAYRAWQDDILDIIDRMWRNWDVETGRSRRGFALSFNPNTGDIEVLNNANNYKGVPYAQYVHRAGRPITDLYIDTVMARLLAGPISEMMDMIEADIQDLIGRSIQIKYYNSGEPG